MAHNKPNSSAGGASSAKRYTALAMLAMALVVGVLAIKSAFRDKADDARSGANNAAANRPSLAQEVYQKARGLMDRGAHAGARKLMLTYVSRHRMDTDVRPLLAEAQIQLGELDDAHKTLSELLRLAPDMAQANHLMSRALKARQDPKYIEYQKRAADCEDAKVEMVSQYGCELLARQDLAGAAQYLQRAYDRGDRGATTLAALGELAAKRFDFAKAVAMLRSSLGAQPRNARTWELLAQALKASGQTAQAAKTIDDGLKHARSGWLLMEKGMMLLDAHQLVAAAETFEDASAHVGFETAGSVRAASAYAQLGQYAKAMAAIDQAIEQAGEESLLAAAAWDALAFDPPIAGLLAGESLAVLELRARIEDLRFGNGGER